MFTLTVMAPNTGKTNENEKVATTKQKPVVSREYLQARSKGDAWCCLEHIIWPNVAYFALLHLGTVYGLYLAFTNAKWMTVLFAVVLHYFSLIGTAAGAHRLWAHQSYKAAFPLRVIFAVCHSMTFVDQNSIFDCVRRHRLHHRYLGTNADPFNVNRGLFFAHCGWLMVDQHLDVQEYGDRIADDDDLMTDAAVRCQHRYYFASVLLFCFLLPTALPVFLWEESSWIAFWVAAIARYTIGFHCHALSYSVGQRFGDRPYDLTIASTDSVAVSWLTLGEGFQNFHYTFLWDYSASESGLNLTTFVLNQLAKIGWVSDRRSASREMIQRRRLRTGDKLN